LILESRHAWSISIAQWLRIIGASMVVWRDNQGGWHGSSGFVVGLTLRLGYACASGTSPIAFDVHLEDGGVVDEAVDGGDGHRRIGEHLAPIAERLIRGDHQRAALRPSRTWGCATVGLVGEPGGGMKWRVVTEVTRADGAVLAYEIGGGAAVDEYSPGTVGLTLAEGKLVLAGLQHHLVQAQTEDHCCRRRRCQRCGALRPIKDKRSRRLLSLFGTVNVSAPRFEPCRCAVTRRQTLSPVSEIMPDRCTPEYERVVAEMGASLPYRRARTLLSEFLPLDDIPSVETARQRTIRVGARLEKEAVASAKVAEPTSVETESIALSIDGGHVRSVRHYQVRSFKVLLAQVTNDDGKQLVFSSVPAEAISQQGQLRGVLNKLGATAVTPVTILSDG
jgi:hypothetical protein